MAQTLTLGMSLRLSNFILVCIFILFHYIHGNERFKRTDNNTPKKQAPAPPLLNTDLIPSLEEILRSIDLEHRTKDLYKMGIVDNRILLRLKKMDFHMMTMEWENVTSDEIDRLKSSVEKLIVQATVTEIQVAVKDNTERDKLNFGRFMVPGCVQNFEYLAASFGGVAPVGLRELVISIPESGCSIDESLDGLKNKIIIVKRGECSFLQKAMMVQQAGATGLIIVNNEDRLDNIASGFGIEPSVTEGMVNKVSKLSIISLSNTSWIPLVQAAKNSVNGSPLVGQIIPLKCGGAGSCAPVLEEEKNINLEITSGQLKPLSEQGQSFEFLTSTFGGKLPTAPVRVFMALPSDACSPLKILRDATMSGESSPYAVYTQRGGCRFEDKVKYAQDAGADLLIVADMLDDALQRIGASAASFGFLGIPAILVTAPAGKWLEEAVNKDSSLSTVVEISPSTDDSVSKAWIELAYTIFEGEDSLLHINGLLEQYTDRESKEIVSWLERKVKKIITKHTHAL
jgi:PA domain